MISGTPNLPTNIIPTKICLTQAFSRKFPTGPGIPPLDIKIVLGSKSRKSRILVRRLAVPYVSRRVSNEQNMKRLRSKI